MRRSSSTVELSPADFHGGRHVIRLKRALKVCDVVVVDFVILLKKFPRQSRSSAETTLLPDTYSVYYPMHLGLTRSSSASGTAAHLSYRHRPTLTIQSTVDCRWCRQLPASRVPGAMTRSSRMPLLFGGYSSVIH